MPPSVQDNPIAAREALFMLVVTPEPLYGRIGAVLSALIVVFCIIGLTMHKDFYAGKERKSF